MWEPVTSAEGTFAPVQELPATHDDVARRLVDIADPRGDGPCVTVLAGETGVGRSAVLTAVSAAMRDAGVDVLQGWAISARGGWLFGALYDVLL